MQTRFGIEAIEHICRAGDDRRRLRRDRRGNCAKAAADERIDPERFAGSGIEPDQAGGLDLQQLSQGKDSQLDAAVKALTK